MSVSYRETLGDEIETLLNDIQFLYECLDDEATYRAETQGTYSREPTIAGEVAEAKLRKYRGIFEEHSSEK